MRRDDRQAHASAKERGKKVRKQEVVIEHEQLHKASPDNQVDRRSGSLQANFLQSH